MGEGNVSILSLSIREVIWCLVSSDNCIQDFPLMPGDNTFYCLSFEYIQCTRYIHVNNMIDWLIDKCLTAYQQRGHLRPNKVKTCWGLETWSVKRIKIKNWIRVKNKYVNKIQDKSSKVKGESFKVDDIREFHERNSVSQ